MGVASQRPRPPRLHANIDSGAPPIDRRRRHFMDMAGSLLLAIALMLIIEGMFPFVFPTAWRETFRRIAERPAHHIRIGGLIVMALGLLLLVAAT